VAAAAVDSETEVVCKVAASAVAVLAMEIQETAG